LIFTVTWAYEHGSARFGEFLDFMNELDPLVYEEKLPRSREKLFVAAKWQFDTLTWTLSLYEDEFAVKLMLLKPSWLQLIKAYEQ
jgi:hypothetical protein